mmetsp:Transcript_5714/g.16529  ORF Transcript_5714/g.16529 Transcript_5714/m.16529 type:complete len:210 (+) Transcript_5714:318-947(+)
MSASPGLRRASRSSNHTRHGPAGWCRSANLLSLRSPRASPPTKKKIPPGTSRRCAEAAPATPAAACCATAMAGGRAVASVLRSTNLPSARRPRRPQQAAGPHARSRRSTSGASPSRSDGIVAARSAAATGCRGQHLASPAAAPSADDAAPTPRPAKLPRRRRDAGPPSCRGGQVALPAATQPVDRPRWLGGEARISPRARTQMAAAARP